MRFTGAQSSRLARSTPYFWPGIEPINFRRLSGKIKQVRLLAAGSELNLEKPRWQLTIVQDVVIDFSISKLSVEVDTIAELEIMPVKT